MPRDTLRLVIVIGLLVIALVAAGLLVWLPASRAPQSAEAGFTFVTDIDNWRQTDQQRVVYTPYDFRLSSDLAQLPFQLGRWKGQDIPQTNLEVFILLEPEQYVYRRYQDEAGHMLWLSLIGSRKSKSFHPPQICYSADGWRTEVSSTPLTLREGEVYALQLLATKGELCHLVWYFYLWPDARRDPAAGTVLFKVTVPIMDMAGIPDTKNFAQDFVQAIFTRSAKP